MSAHGHTLTASTGDGPLAAAQGADLLHARRGTDRLSYAGMLKSRSIKGRERAVSPCRRTAAARLAVVCLLAGLAGPLSPREAEAEAVTLMATAALLVQAISFGVSLLDSGSDLTLTLVGQNREMLRENREILLTIRQQVDAIHSRLDSKDAAIEIVLNKIDSLPEEIRKELSANDIRNARLRAKAALRRAEADFVFTEPRNQSAWPRLGDRINEYQLACGFILESAEQVIEDGARTARRDAMVLELSTAMVWRMLRCAYDELYVLLPEAMMVDAYENGSGSVNRQQIAVHAEVYVQAFDTILPETVKIGDRLGENIIKYLLSEELNEHQRDYAVQTILKELSGTDLKTRSEASRECPSLPVGSPGFAGVRSYRPDEVDRLYRQGVQVLSRMGEAARVGQNEVAVWARLVHAWDRLTHDVARLTHTLREDFDIAGQTLLYELPSEFWLDPPDSGWIVRFHEDQLARYTVSRGWLADRLGRYRNVESHYCEVVVPSCIPFGRERCVIL